MRFAHRTTYSSLLLAWRARCPRSICDRAALLASDQARHERAQFSRMVLERRQHMERGRPARLGKNLHCLYFNTSLTMNRESPYVVALSAEMFQRRCYGP